MKAVGNRAGGGGGGVKGAEGQVTGTSAESKHCNLHPGMVVQVMLNPGNHEIKVTVHGRK